ncbi:DNA polymerase [Yersinia phage MHG19]|nr:DNA polymerase [Yersinia phage MHG19]
MKFSRETLNILKNFSTINSGIVLKKGNFIMTRAVNGTSYGEATIPDTVDIDVGIYDLNGFLGILGLVGEEAEISMDTDGNILIKDARSEIFWPSADESTIPHPSKPIPFPVANVIFDLKGDDLQQLMRVSRGLAIDTLGVTTKDGKIIINGYNKSADSSSMRVLYSVEVGEYDGTNNFCFMINMANMKMQPADYKVLIAAQGAIKFEGSHASYVVALEADSSNDF